MARGATQIGHALSESETLGAVIEMLTRMRRRGDVQTPREMDEAIDLLYALQRQAKAGVHKNVSYLQLKEIPQQRGTWLLKAADGSYYGTFYSRASGEQAASNLGYGVISESADDQLAARIPERHRRRNPMLTILGNPTEKKMALRAGELLSRNVQAVLYIHDQDGLPYAHGFGDANITLKTHRDGTVCVGGMKDDTGIAMVGLKSGEILLVDANEVPF